MTASALARPTLLRAVCVGFALSSFALGGFMLVEPDAFWRSVGLGGSPLVSALYGAGIVGEGAMFALCARRPRRYLVFFEYMVVYKTLACLAGARVLASLPSAPIAGWGVIAGWAVAGLVSVVVTANDPTRCDDPAPRV